MDTYDIPADVIASVRADVLAQVRAEIRAEVANAISPKSPADDDPTIRARLNEARDADELVRLIRESNATYDAQKVNADV